MGVRVCCFPSKQLSPVYRIGISPDTYEPWPYTLRQMVGWAFEPGSEEFLGELIEKGRRDATAWMCDMGLGGEEAAAEVQAARGEGEAAGAKVGAGASPT